MRLAYDVATAAEATSFSKDLIYDAIHSGALRVKKSGRNKDDKPIGKYVILHADLQRWLEGLADA